MKRARTPRASGRPGFSLLELLAVMAIMSMLTTLAVSSYFAAIRGMTRRSAVKHFANTLILARQRACMEGTRLSVVLFNEITGKDASDVTPSYVICKEIGRLTYKSNDRLVDEFTELDRMFGTTTYGDSYRGSIKLYNLTEGKWWNVFPWVESYALPNRRSPYQPTPAPNIWINAFAFEKNKNVNNLNEASWEVGDSYGIEAAPVGTLPRNFQFDALNDNAGKIIMITFNPDGTALFRPSGVVRIVETQQQKGSTVTVTSDGVIEYNDKWN